MIEVMGPPFFRRSNPHDAEKGLQAKFGAPGQGRDTTISIERNGHEAGLEKVWPFDIVPRIIEGHEWSHVERGLAQRIRALNCFLDDVYGVILLRATGHRGHGRAGRDAKRTARRVGGRAGFAALDGRVAR